MTNPIPTILTEVEGFLGQFRSPAGAVAVLTAVVAVGGEVGILTAPLTGALQTLLSAILGVIVVLTGGKTAQMAAKRAAVAVRAKAGR